MFNVVIWHLMTRLLTLQVSEGHCVNSTIVQQIQIQYSSLQTLNRDGTKCERMMSPSKDLRKSCPQYFKDRDKTEEITKDYRRSRKTHLAPQHILSCLQKHKVLDLYISSDFFWTDNTAYQLKIAQQLFFFFRKLKQTGLPSQLLSNFCRATGEYSVTWHTHTNAHTNKPIRSNRPSALFHSGLSLATLYVQLLNYICMQVFFFYLFIQAYFYVYFKECFIINVFLLKFFFFIYIFYRYC